MLQQRNETLQGWFFQYISLHNLLYIIDYKILKKSNSVTHADTKMAVKKVYTRTAALFKNMDIAKETVTGLMNSIEKNL